jgi:predicted enzyme related to lactoylglutathione lyase
MSDSQGFFIWHELATTDVDAAVRFYEDVIGWGSEAWHGEMPYVRWMAGKDAVGGVAVLPEHAKKAGAPPHWLAYVKADDVDALTTKAASLGGKTLVAATDIPEVGRFSMIADPQGAALALLQPSSPETQPLPADMPPLHFVWNELIAGDREEALRFYSQLFGWQRTEAVDMPNGKYQMYGKGGRTLGGMMTKPDGYPFAPHWLYYVTVPDLDAALARVKKAGGRIMNGPMDVPGGRVAQCFDPQGAQFALHGK